jgi:hypothetical protein
MHGCYNFSLENILTKLNKTILKVRFLTHDTGEKKIFLVIKSSSIPQKKRSFHGPPPIIKGLRAQKVHPRLSRRPNDAPGEAVWPPFVARGGAMAGRWKADHGAAGAKPATFILGPLVPPGQSRGRGAAWRFLLGPF